MQQILHYPLLGARIIWLMPRAYTHTHGTNNTEPIPISKRFGLADKTLDNDNKDWRMFTRVHHWSSVTRNGWSEPSSQLVVITVVTSDRLPSQPNRLCHWRVCLHSAYPSWHSARPDWGRLWHRGDQTDSTMAYTIIMLMQDAWMFYLISLSTRTHAHKRSRHGTSQILHGHHLMQS